MTAVTPVPASTPTPDADSNTNANISTSTHLGTQAGRAAFWNTALLPAKLGTHLVAQLVLANTVPPAAYGVYVLALAVSSTSGAFVDLGTERSVVKFLPEVAGREGGRGVRRLIGWVFGLKMAILLPVLALATLLHRLFFTYVDSRVPANETDIAALVTRNHWTLFGVVVAFVLVGAFYDVAMQSLIATFRNRSWNLVTISVQVIEPLIVIAIVLTGGDIARVLIGRVIVDFIALMIAGTVAIIAMRRSEDEERIYIAEEERGVPMPLQRFTRYSFLQYALQVAAFVQSYAFASIILRNAVDVAGYRIAAGSVSAVLPALLVPITSLQVPVFTRIFSRRDPSQLASAYSLVSRFLALVLVPGAVGMALLVPNLFRLLYPRYATMIPVCIVLVILGFSDSLFSTGTTVMLTFERYRPVILKSCIALLAVPSLFITVPRFGPLGAAVTSGSFAMIASLFGTIMSNRLLPIRYPLSFLGRVVLAALPMALFVGLLVNTVARVPDTIHGIVQRVVSLAATGVIAVVGGAIYLIVFRFLGGIAPEDAARMRSVRVPFASVVLRLLTR